MTNAEERGRILVPIDIFLARSSSSVNLAFGVVPRMNLNFDGIEMMEKQKTALAGFGRPVDDRLIYCRDKSFSTARCVAEGCMGWIWCQWLKAASAIDIRRTVEAFVSRGMEIQQHLPNQRLRGLHDLFLLHCAIFASPAPQVHKLAERVVDAHGNKGEESRNNGELYASAWCGMLKHWVLGDKEQAVRQSELIWGAYRPPYFRAATKPLVSAWLEESRDGFMSQQRKDFDKLWTRALKDGTASRRRTHINLNVSSFPVAQLWCWAHCGLALLAHRQGVQIAIDPFWLPPHALTCIEQDL